MTTVVNLGFADTRMRCVQRLLLAVMACALTACVSIPEKEYAEFTPLPVNKRVIHNVKVSWEVRDDASAVCAGSLKTTANGMLGAPIACAQWSVNRQECTIITGPNPNHVVLGHELRHCFEGHFH